MISGRRHASRHHWNVHRSLSGRAARQRLAAFTRRTTQLLLFQNKTVQIKGVTYSLDRLIGRGGQGAVYEASGPQGQRFAIKMLIWEESTLTTERLLHPSAESFLRELEFMLYLKPHSKHFVEFHNVDVKKVVGLVLGFILMELGDGDLDQMIKEMSNRKTNGNTFIHARDRKFVWRQIVACVKTLHRKNIVNTDLKPGNFITFNDKIKLSDLGMALRTNKPEQSYRGGTPGWSAPEVMYPQWYPPRARRVSPKADIWSLGVILYYMTYGTIPRVTNVGCSDASTPPPGKQIVQDANLQNILRLTLQMDPANRPTIRQLEQHPYTLSVS